MKTKKAGYPPHFIEKKSRNAEQLTQSKNAQDSIPKPEGRTADSVFKNSSPEYLIPIHPSRTDAFKSHGRARARKTAIAAFGKKQSNKIWHAGPLDSLATIFHAWRWGRERPSTADLMMPVYTSPQQRLVPGTLQLNNPITDRFKSHPTRTDR
jgi:hypothetical protein